jgi:hypothetical protein
MPTFGFRDAVLLVFKRNDPLVGWFANFKRCSEDVAKLDRSACLDSDYYCRVDPKTSQLLEPVRVLLTQEGCLRRCGVGFELWEALDSVSRFVLWLVPLFILIAHFQYPPLGWKNTIVVVCGLVANPIGSMWSMLTRQERYRRAYLRAKRAGLPNHKDIAVVAAACDHYDWNDPLHGWLEALRNRTKTENVRENMEATLIEETLHARGEATSGEESEISRANGDEGEGEAQGEKNNTNVIIEDEREHPTNAVNRDAHEEPSPADNSSTNDAPPTNTEIVDQYEQYYFAESANEIVSHSTDSTIGTLFTILGLVAALLGAFGRQWANRQNTWLPHTIPNVALAYHFIPLVQVSASIGGLTSMFGPLRALQKLQKRLRKRDEKLKRAESHRLNLHIDLDSAIKRNTISGNRGESSQPLLEEQVSQGDDAQSNNCWISLPDDWQRHGAYLGMNMTFRPQKTVGNHDMREDGGDEERGEKKVKRKKGESGDRGRIQLFIYALLFVTISYETAFYLSYVTVTRQGFGCRALTWTLIYATWLISVLIDVTLSSAGISKKQQLWHWTKVKDVIISVIIGLVILGHHIGVTNTCLCHAGSIIDNRRVNVLPPSDDEWRQSWILWPGGSATGLLLMILLLLWVQFFVGRHGASLLCPSKDELHKLETRLDEMKKQLGRRDSSVVEAEKTV